MYANNFGRFTAVDPSQNSVHLPNPQTWNRYIYCFNNPLTLVDRNGKWPIDTHIALTLSTFKGLSKTELSVITAGVLSVDGASDGKPLSTYWPSEAYKHYMTPDGMTSDDAWQAGKDWLKGKLEAAKGAQRDWEASGKDGISPSAFFAVGEAAHLYQDMTSPAHGLDKTYSVPTIEVEVGGIKINVPDIAKFRQEQKEHNEQESRDPTPEEWSKSQHYARTFFPNSIWK